MDTTTLIWLDLEMTGLDATRDEICEVAMLATDSQLTPLDDGIDLVVRPTDEALQNMDSFVQKMHKRSGLLTELETARLNVADAEQEIMGYLRAHVKEAQTVPLCGNSIAVDRRFLIRYMQKVDEYLHYRDIDVSTIKELCRRWYPDVFAQLPKKQESHRALDDVKESIAELAWYREKIFVPI